MIQAARVLAPNPGPFTLEGTNTWVVGTGACLVIDPGPDDPGHLEAILATSGRVGEILLTHHHLDHAEGAPRLAAMTGAPVLASHPGSGELALEDGVTVEGGGVSLLVVATPGHARDHLAFLEPQTGALFTGDAVLGRGTSVIDPPEGDMSAYLRTLERLAELAPDMILPGHGPSIRPAGPALREYLDHRRLRERQVLEAVRAGAETPEGIVGAVYRGYPPEVLGAAGRSVLAHLLKLEREGSVIRSTTDPDRFVPMAGPGPPLSST